jgi:hypothetical protein
MVQTRAGKQKSEREQRLTEEELVASALRKEPAILQTRVKMDPVTMLPVISEPGPMDRDTEYR